MLTLQLLDIVGPVNIDLLLLRAETFAGNHAACWAFAHISFYWASMIASNKSAAACLEPCRHPLALSSPGTTKLAFAATTNVWVQPPLSNAAYMVFSLDSTCRCAFSSS